MLSLELSASAALQGGRLVRMRLPAALLCTALADPDYDIGRCRATQRLGALAGLAGLCIERAGGILGSNGLNLNFLVDIWVRCCGNLCNAYRARPSHDLNTSTFPSTC